jgi:hypothetical protein
MWRPNTHGLLIGKFGGVSGIKLAEVRRETEKIGNFAVESGISRVRATAGVRKVDVVQTYPLEAWVELMQTLRKCSYGRINGARTAKHTRTGRW